MAQPAARRETNFIKTKESVIGTKVVNAQNEDLGKIEDIILEAGSGRAAYAVLSFGFLGLGDKDFLIPWSAFSFDFANNRALLNVDKDRLKHAPGFDRDKWPNMTDPTFGRGVSQYYGYDYQTGVGRNT
jgi:PRC-barrel domain